MSAVPPSPGHKSKPSFSFVSFFEASKDDITFNQKPKPVYQAANKKTRRNSNDNIAGLFGGETNVSRWNQVPAVVPIAAWIGFSSCVILFNKYILYDLHFPYPIFLTTCHLLFQTCATRLARRFTNLVDGAKKLEASGKMNRTVFVRTIIPLGLLFSLSLALSNWVYLRLTVSFIQMIKAITPIVVLLLSFAFSLKEPSKKLFTIICLISLGVGIASYGEIAFDMSGFLVQLLAIVIESSRLVLIQMMLKDTGMDPLTSLYYYAPVCLAFNSFFFVAIEGFAPLYTVLETVGGLTLLVNCCITLGLNFCSVWLIGKASGLVLTLAGVVKDILIIAFTFTFQGSPVTSIQMFGYSIALAGLIMYKRS
ncbi:TPT-domain-containing protein [Atractiella rhizophila]|nr:TPT-domain-containing protein [Atractiella rhizophila]